MEMPVNIVWWAIPVAALVPMVMGFIWYSKPVFGKAWMAASGMTDEKVKSGNMGLIFGLSYVFANLLALMLLMVTVHEFPAQSLIFTDAGQPSAEGLAALKAFLSAGPEGAEFGRGFMTFKHGAFHGAIAGIMFALPVLATNAMFERRSFKYVAVNAGYWIVTIAIMGGVVCQLGAKVVL